MFHYFPFLFIVTKKKREILSVFFTGYRPVMNIYGRRNFTRVTYDTKVSGAIERKTDSVTFQIFSQWNSANISSHNPQFFITLSGCHRSEKIFALKAWSETEIGSRSPLWHLDYNYNLNANMLKGWWSSQFKIWFKMRIMKVRNYHNFNFSSDGRINYFNFY